MTQQTIELPTVSDDALDTLFRKGRTANSFSSEPVPAEKLQEIYEIAKFGPTAMNSLPLRVIYLTSDEAKQRVLPFMSAGNRPKTTSAPVVAILAADADYHERLIDTFPHAPEAKDWVGGLEARKEQSQFNAGLQIAYYIMAVRALGLAAGPMNGFDKAGVDQEFFAGTNIHSLVVLNIGYPGENPWFDRLPRLDYSEVVRVL